MPNGTRNNNNGVALELEVAAVCRRLGLFSQNRHLLDASIGLAPHGTQTRLSVWVDACRLFPMGLGIDASSYTDSGTAHQKGLYKVVNAGGWACPGIVILDGEGRGIPIRGCSNKTNIQLQGNLLNV